MGGIETWFQYAKGAVLSPDEFYAEIARMEITDYGIPLSFALLSATIAAYLSAGVQLLQQPFMLQSTPDLLFLLGLGLVTGVIGGLVIVPLWSAILHLFVDIAGGTPYGRSYQQTLTVTSYSTAAVAFLGWIPYVNILAGLYAAYLQFHGVQNLHDFDRNRAITAVGLPALLLFGGGAALYYVAPGTFYQLLWIPRQLVYTLYGLL